MKSGYVKSSAGVLWVGVLLSVLERLWRWRWRWLRCVPSADHRAAVRPELSDGGRNCLPHLCDQTATCGTDSGVQIRDAGLFMSIATRTTSAS